MAQQPVDLRNQANLVHSLFAEAAERCRAQAVWEAGEPPFERPSGVGTICGFVHIATEKWRELAESHGLLVEAPEEPAPVVGEPHGLSPDLLLLYRQFAAQVAAAEGE